MKSFSMIMIATVSLILAACGEVKKVDEMRDNTREMNETTKTLLDKTGDMKTGLDKMSKTTDQMRDITADLAKTTEKMNKTTARLYDGMRQGDTSGLRRELFKQIPKDSKLEGQIGDAGLYLMAFEFQVLGSTGHDEEPGFREMLYQQAMLEFFLKINEVAPKHFDVHPGANPTGKADDDESKTAAFNAIAFALHKTNRQQVADPRYGKPMSFYDLIIEALRMKPKIDSGEIVLPEGRHWVKEVLARPRRVQQLLQTRYNMFPFGMLGLTTNLVDFSKVTQLWKLLWDIDINLSESFRGRAELQYILEEVVGPAATTADDMISVGIEPEFTTMTGVVLRGMKLKFHADSSVQTLIPVYQREETVGNLWSRYLQAAR